VPSQRLDLHLEVFYRLERAVDAGEPEVRDLVELTQRAEDGQPDLVTRDLCAARRADRVLHPLGQLREVVFADRAALAGPADTGDDLGSAERFGHAAALDHREGGLFHRREPTATSLTRPAPADDLTLVHLTGVEHSRVGMPAVGTTHAQTSLSMADRGWRRSDLWTDLGTTGVILGMTCG
jgi:hypothetical protein